MGRLVAAQRTCSRMDLFQDAVAGIFTHAFRRNYTRRLVHGVWTKFLLRYWDAAGNPTKELRDWFHRTWKGIVDAEGREAKAPPGQSPTQPSATAPIERPLRRAPVPAADPLVEHPRPAVDEAHSGSGGGRAPSEFAPSLVRPASCCLLLLFSILTDFPPQVPLLFQDANNKSAPAFYGRPKVCR